MLLAFDDAQGYWTRPLDAWAERLDEGILPRRWSGRLRRALEAEATAASTRMEGVPVTVDDTLRILAGDPPEHVSDADQAVVRGYREAMTYVQRRADDGRLVWKRELIVAVQDRVLAGSFANGAGRPREGSAWVMNSLIGAVVFQPPDHEQVAGLSDEMCATVESARWDPAIAAAWIHVALAAVHPFRDGNGRTARVLSSLAMYRGGFKHPAFTNLEEWWGKSDDGVFTATSSTRAPRRPVTTCKRQRLQVCSRPSDKHMAVVTRRGRRLAPALAKVIGGEVAPEDIIRTLVARASADFEPVPSPIQERLPGLGSRSVQGVP